MKPPRPNIFLRIAALEGKKRTKFDLMRQLTPEDVAASMTIALMGRRYDPQAMAEALDCDISEAQSTIDKFKALDALRPRRKSVPKEDAVIRRVAETLSRYPEIIERVGLRSASSATCRMLRLPNTRRNGGCW